MYVNYSKKSIEAQLALLGYDIEDITSYRIYYLTKHHFEFYEFDADEVIEILEYHDHPRTNAVLMVQYYLCEQKRDDIFSIDDVIASQLLQRAVV